MLFYFYNRLKRGLRLGIRCSGGRNMLGRVCIRGRGCGNKRLCLNIDIFRRICQFGVISKFVYDARRSAIVGYLLYTNGLSAFIILTQGSLQLGKFLYSGFLFPDLLNFAIDDGWALPIRNFPLFSQLSNVEFVPQGGFSISRSAGCSVVLISKSLTSAILKLRSGWHLSLDLNCFAVKGCVSNSQHHISF